MPRFSVAALALLAACGSPAPEPEPANVAAPVAGTATPEPAPQPVEATAPAPGELKTFGDWSVGCDNGGACKAVSLAPDKAMAGEWPTFMPAIERDGGPDGAVRIVFSGQGEPKPPTRILVDGKLAGTGNGKNGSVTGDDARRVAEALANGRTARVESGGASGGVSLAGASAALRYMDDRQGHAGSAAALVAKGGGPDGATVRSLPTVRVPATGGEVPKLTPKQVEAMRTASGCEYFNDINRGDPALYPLGGGRTLAMLPCGAGAYNEITALFIVENGTARPAPVDYHSGIEGAEEKAPTVVNADYADGVISSWAKGRGLGDCGIAQRFAWDGERFRLIEQSELRECRGNTELITTWRAKVVR